VIIDTTVQEKNITFPTDNKLRLKIIAKTKKFAKRHEIKLKQTYEKEVKELKVKGRFSHHPKRKKEAKRAGKRLKTIAGILVREVGRKDKVGNFETNKALYERILAQKRTSKNKIYSIHEPAVSCIAKGKEHAPYEFGAKTSISILAKIGRSSLPLQKISKRNKGRDFFFARLFSTILDRTTIYSQNFWIFKAKVCALKQTYYELNDFLRVD
jgi:IS5 family transposase